MTSFVDITYSTQHPGVARVESAIQAAKQLRQGVLGKRGLMALLLGAITVAFMSIAYLVMDSVAEGHVMVLWIGFWALAFAVLVLFGGTSARLGARLLAGLDGWSRSLAEARADRRLWAMAQGDAHLMAVLQAALLRKEALAEDTPLQPAITAARTSKAERTVRLGSSVLRAYQRNYI